MSKPADLPGYENVDWMAVLRSMVEYEKGSFYNPWTREDIPLRCSDKGHYFRDNRGLWVRIMPRVPDEKNRRLWSETWRLVEK